MKCCVSNCAAGEEKSTFDVPKNENLKNNGKTILTFFLKVGFDCVLHIFTKLM